MRASIGQGVQGAVVSVGFALLLVGTNAINPLLPVYRAGFNFDPLLLSLTFVVYVAVLIATLLFFTRPKIVHLAPLSIAASLLFAIASDLLLATTTESGVLVGRALAGVAGGVGTGAASALVVAALGSRGRAVSATGNLVGAVVGNSFALAWVTHSPARAPHAIFEIHAAACALVFMAVVVVMILRRAENDLALGENRIPNDGDTSRRLSAVPLITGCIGWIAVSSGIVLLPLYFDDLDLGLARGAGPIAMLSASALGQLASPRIARVAPGVSGMIALAAGSALMLMGGLARAEPLALSGFVVMGLGIGISYRLGLVTFSKGASPARQGRLASWYAAITYASAAATVLVSGAVAGTVGLMPVVIVTYSVLGIASLGMLVAAPRLRDARERDDLRVAATD